MNILLNHVQRAFFASLLFGCACLFGETISSDSLSGLILPETPDLSQVPPQLGSPSARQRARENQKLSQRIDELSKKINTKKAPQPTGPNKKPEKKDRSPSAVASKSPVAELERKASEPEPTLTETEKDTLAIVYSDPELQGKISLRTKEDTPVKDVIELVARLGNIDIAIDPDVEGTVGRINCSGCTVGYILRWICASNTPELALIKYFNTWRVMTRAKAGRLLLKQKDNDFAFDVFTIKHALFSDEFTKRIKDMWANITSDTKGARSYISFDSVGRKVFVFGFRQHLNEFRNFIKEVDTSVPQVRIDVVIVLARKNYAYALGVDWSGVYNRQASVQAKRPRLGLHGIGANLGEYPTPIGEPIGLPTDHRPTDAKNPGLFVDPFNFALNLFGTAVSTAVEPVITLPLVFGGSNLNTRRLNLLLNAAEDQKKLKIVARPSVLANSNELADILVGQSIPLETIAQNVTETTQQNVTTTTYKDIGVQIKVRPVVNMENHTVFIDIFIQASTLTENETFTRSTDDSGNRGVQAPVIDTVRMSTKVLLRSGQTAVIGGILQSQTKNQVRSVPILSRLPIIGKLFSGELEAEQEDEQVTFITPTIVEHEIAVD